MGEEFCKQIEGETKERHALVTLWLWLMVVINPMTAIGYVASMFTGYYHDVVLGSGILAILHIINLIAAQIQLHWKKNGYYLFVASKIGEIVVVIFILHKDPFLWIAGLLAIILWWAILQIRRDGVSAWSQLTSGWDFKNCRNIYLTGIGLIVLLGILTSVPLKF